MSEEAAEKAVATAKGEALALREELDDIKARAEESARAAAVATHTMKKASVRG